MNHPWWQYALGLPMFLAGLPLVVAWEAWKWGKKRGNKERR